MNTCETDGKKKLNNEIVRRLRSDKLNLVIPVLNHLRQSIHAAAYLPEVIHLLNETKNTEIRRELSFFLSDIKDPEGIPHIIDALRDEQYKPVWNIIISSCWQSSLNYSKALDTFIGIFLKEDYLTSLEAFSVIEQSIPYLEEQKLGQYRKQLVTGLNKVDKDKAPLVREMIKIMED
jgi:3-methyladenine DNA glycosylase AlkC